jgi:hypothetical protein
VPCFVLPSHPHHSARDWGVYVLLGLLVLVAPPLLRWLAGDEPDNALRHESSDARPGEDEPPLDLLAAA